MARPATSAHTASIVAWPLAPAVGRDDLDDCFTASLEDAAGSGLDLVLPAVGVQTASIFNYRADGDDPRLVWYVEHPDDPPWADPSAVIRETAPLFDTALAEFVDGHPLAVTDGAPDSSKLVHAALADRPAAYADRTSSTPIVISGDDSSVEPPDVVPLRLDLTPRVGTSLARVFAGVVARTPR